MNKSKSRKYQKQKNNNLKKYSNIKKIVSAGCCRNSYPVGCSETALIMPIFKALMLLFSKLFPTCFQVIFPIHQKLPEAAALRIFPLSRIRLNGAGSEWIFSTWARACPS